ncbi:MAG: Rab family GTPase [Candidatus Hodarchaeales archaeon]
MGFFRKKNVDEKKSEEKEEIVATVFKKESTDGKQSRRRRRRSIKDKRRRSQVDFFMKLVLCGDGAVGKTALRKRFLGEGFSSNYLQTIGADFSAIDKEIDVPNVGVKKVKYQIWDLAGQPEFKGVRGAYYEGCFGALMIFDLTRPNSFENLSIWINELWKKSGRGKIPVVILGNKADLIAQFPEHVKPDIVKRFTDKLNEEVKQYKFTIPYLETSALTGKNVNEAFIKMGESVLSWIENKDK